MTLSYPTHEQIAIRAKEIWENEGRPTGRALDHWVTAETELMKAADEAEIASGSNPASNPSAEGGAKKTSRTLPGNGKPPRRGGGGGRKVPMGGRGRAIVAPPLATDVATPEINANWGSRGL